jgi:hypothetical protein
MSKKINTFGTIGVIIAAVVVFGGLIWLKGKNIKVETPTVSTTQPAQKLKTVNTTKIDENKQQPSENQNKKLTYTSNNLSVSFDYEISGNQAIICENENFIFDTENESCPKSQEDINFALASPDVILEVFTKNQDKSMESSIKDILIKEKVNLQNCNIDFSQKDFLYEPIPNKQIAAIFAKGNICNLNDTVSGAKPCKRAEDICQSKYVNNTLTTSHNFFVYNTTESKTKFVFHQCDNCYESRPDITIDLNSIKFNTK